MGYSIGRAEANLNFVRRILADLARFDDNYILFDNLQLALLAIEVDLQFTEDILLKHYPTLFKLIGDYPSAEHKIAVRL